MKDYSITGVFFQHRNRFFKSEYIGNRILFSGGIMKKLIASISLAMLCLLFFSCQSTPNMSELLSYQKSGATFEVKISDGDEFSAKITLGEKDTVELCGDSKTDGIRFVINGEEAQIEYDGGGSTSMKLASAKRLKAAKWVSLFRLPSNSLWKIKSETYGGIAVYVCTCEDIALYIDTASKTPLKITDGDLVIDILSCQS